MSSEDYDNYEPVLFGKGFSKNWNDIDLRKRNTYGQIGMSEQAYSEYGPDLDYDEIDLVNKVKGVDCVTDHVEMEQPEENDDKLPNVWQEFDLKPSYEINDALSEIAVIRGMEEIKSEGGAASEHTPINKHLLSSESFPENRIPASNILPLKKLLDLHDGKRVSGAQTTMAQSKELLREKVDDHWHVKNWLNRKDVVIKSILRSMRKYYSDLVQDNSEYKRKIRNIKLKHKTLINWAIDMAHTLGLSEADNNVAFYLTAIAFPTDLRKILKKTQDENIDKKPEILIGLRALDKIENAMTRFSRKVMDDFMSIPEICMLLLNYLSKVKNQEYQEHYKSLKEMAENTLKNCDEMKLLSSSATEGKMIEFIK